MTTSPFLAVGGVAVLLTTTVLAFHTQLERDPGPPAIGDVGDPPEIEAVRRATERFRDVDVALAEGYVPDPAEGCITAAHEGQPRQLGGMGLHYFRPDLLGLRRTEPRVYGDGLNQDFENPSVLIYVPSEDGKRELVAVENLVWVEAWERAGHEARPEYLGHEYFLMIDNPLTPVDEAHGFEPHYELHLWVHRDNPAGMFFPFNPTVSCPSGKTGVPHPPAARARPGETREAR